jgi:hypothetical protein
MPTSRYSLVNASRDCALSILLALAAAACSSDSQGIIANDGSRDVTGRIDGGASSEAGMGQGGAGGSVGKLDAAGAEAPILPGAGGTTGLDGGGLGRGGRSGTGGVGGGGVGGSGPLGFGGFVRGSGGVGGSRTSIVAGGTGGSVRLDAAPVSDAGIDAPVPLDVALDERPGNRDASSNQSEVNALDGSTTCGALDQPCCEQRTCDAPDLVCNAGGTGGGATCVACGGDGEPCCEGDVCTAPNTTCVGGRGGTCR